MICATFAPAPNWRTVCSWDACAKKRAFYMCQTIVYASCLLMQYFSLMKHNQWIKSMGIRSTKQSMPNIPITFVLRLRKSDLNNIPCVVLAPVPNKIAQNKEKKRRNGAHLALFAPAHRRRHLLSPWCHAKFPADSYLYSFPLASINVTVCKRRTLHLVQSVPRRLPPPRSVCRWQPYPPPPCAAHCQCRRLQPYSLVLLVKLSTTLGTSSCILPLPVSPLQLVDDAARFFLPVVINARSWWWPCRSCPRWCWYW